MEMEWNVHIFLCRGFFRTQKPLKNLEPHSISFPLISPLPVIKIVDDVDGDTENCRLLIGFQTQTAFPSHNFSLQFEYKTCWNCISHSFPSIFSSLSTKLLRHYYNYNFMCYDVEKFWVRETLYFHFNNLPSSLLCLALARRCEWLTKN